MSKGALISGLVALILATGSASAKDEIVNKAQGPKIEIRINIGTAEERIDDRLLQQSKNIEHTLLHADYKTIVPTGIGYSIGYYIWGFKITVQAGDYLDVLAAKLSQITGKEISWQELFNYNKETIGKNPDLIKPGMILEYPTMFSPRADRVL